MDKIIMLGTGNGGTLDLYNTCFAIQHDNDNFLVDTGGEIEIIKRLKQINIQLKNIKKYMIIFHENIIQVNKITFQAYFYTFYVNFATFLYINVIIYS